MTHSTTSPASPLRWPVCLTAAAMLLSAGISHGVASKIPSHWLTAGWLLSILLLVIVVFPSRPWPAWDRKTWGWLGFAIVLALGIRLALTSIWRVHDDDFTVSYFSVFREFRSVSFFAPMPLDPGDWVSQFPRIFFFFQKLFFKIFGTGPWTIKLSIFPYTAITAASLFLLARELFGLRAGIIASVLFATFAFSVYFDTWTLLLSPSTAVFTTFFYTAIRYYRRGNPANAVLCGLSAGSCFMFYTGSYLILPFFFLIVGLRWIRNRTWNEFLSGCFAILAWLLVLAPFIGYVSSHPNYFAGRINNQSLLTGAASSAPEAIRQGKSPYSIILDNVIYGFRCFYTDDFGGDGGFNFGRIAALAPGTEYLFALGFLLGLAWIFRRHELAFLLSALVVAFLALVGLSYPHGAFHRIAAALPLFALVWMLPFEGLFRIRFLPRGAAVIITVVGLLLIAGTNYHHFQRAVGRDSKQQDIQLAEIINRDYPGRNIYVAAFPSFSFDRGYFFSAHRNARSITTDYHRELMPRINLKEKYVIVIHSPYELGARETIWEKFVLDIDPNGKLIPFSDNYSLMVN